MKLTKRHLTGKDYLATATDFLQRIRLEGAHEGLYEAADVQWWWREDDAADPERRRFWFNEQGNAVACFVQLDTETEWSNDFIWLPSARPQINDEVIPEIVAACPSDKASVIYVREDDLQLQQALEAVGFMQGDDTLIQAEIAHDPAKTPLAPTLQMKSRIEDTLPHHLIQRNGDNIQTKLNECSLYRPELDLCVRDEAGNVAAYALFWMDDVTKVGLLEPLRTERAFQRLGLARHLIAEGIARLRELGAASIRVGYSPNNEAAASLYHQVGFEDRIKKLEYRRDLHSIS